MNFLNELKRDRAERVVTDPSKFTAESVERVALEKVDPKLSKEEKVVEVYKSLGGAFGPEDAEDAGALKKMKKAKDE